MKKILTKFPLLVLALLVGLMAAPSAFGAVTIVIQNNDPAGVGFNDPTTVSPVGGNNANTLGQQRLNAFQFAADVWGATLNSSNPNVVITIGATWSDQMECTTNSATLGSAGTFNIHANFTNAPFGDTWYGAALANALAGRDLNTTNPEIRAKFNSKIGTPGCLDNSGWYLGFDGNHGSKIDLVAVLLHEFGHGLGFQTFTNAQTGVQITPTGGTTPLPSIYDKFLFDNTTNKLWSNMTDAERAASAINTGKLVWTGPQVTNDAKAILGSPRLRVNSPAAIAGNFTVGTADFGAPLSSAGVTGNVVQALDPIETNISPNGTSTDGCSPFSNASAVSGKIALIDRGNCPFVVKTKNAQNAGAIGVMIVNNVSSPAVSGMTGSDATLTIPTVMVSLADGNTIKNQLTAGVNATLLLDTSAAAGADASGHPLMFSPNPYDQGSSVSHWDTSAFPNQLMEPNISGDLSHSVTTPRDLTASLMKDIGWSVNLGTVVTPTPTPTPTPAPTPAGPATLALSSTAYSASEGDVTGALTFTVVRTGDSSGAVSVDYTTSDLSGSIPCQTNGNGIASDRCDYASRAGTVRFAAGDVTPKTVQIPLINDSYVEPTEIFTIRLKNAQGAALGAAAAAASIIDNDTQTATTNPINDQAFFIREQYVDFLGRVAEQGGFDFWNNRMNGVAGYCQPGEICDRVDTAQKFFESDEFRERGFYVYKLYDASLARFPLYSEFVPEVARLNGPQTVQEQRLGKDAYLLDFMNKTEFKNLYDQYLSTDHLRATNPTGFVNALCAKAGITPASKQTLIDNLANGARDPAHTLEDFILTPEIDGVGTRFYDRARIVMQYFGFLRRDPDTGGFNFWWNRVATVGSPQYHDYRVLVNDFIRSDEYNFRFAFLPAP